MQQPGRYQPYGPNPKRPRETSPPRPVPQAGWGSSSTSPPRDHHPVPAHLQDAEPQSKWRRPLEHGGAGPSRTAVQGPPRRPPEQRRPSDDGTSGDRLARAEATSTELRAQLARLQAQLNEVKAHAGERTQAAVREVRLQAAAELTRARQAAVDAGRARLQEAQNDAKAWERQAEAAASANEQLRRKVAEKEREALAERNEAAARQREAEGANAKLALLRRRAQEASSSQKEWPSRERTLRAQLTREAQVAAAAAAADGARREARLRELTAGVLSGVGAAAAAEEAAAAAMRQLDEAEARAAQRAQLGAEVARLEAEVARLEAEVARLRAEVARRGEEAERRAPVPPPAAGGAGGVGAGQGEGKEGEELGTGEVRRARGQQLRGGGGQQLSFGDALLVWEQNQHTVRELLDDGKPWRLALRREELVREVTEKLGGKVEWWRSRSGHRRLYAPLQVSFEGEAGVDEGGLSVSLYQSYFGQLFAAPALCESHEEGLPLPAPGAAEEAMQACGRLLAKMIVDGWCAQPFAPFLWHVLRDSHEDALSSSALALEQLAAFDPHKARSWRLLLDVASQAELDEMHISVGMITGEDGGGEGAAGGEGGSEPLRLGNRHEAVRVGCRRLLFCSRRRALQAVQEGFAAARLGAGLRLWSVAQLTRLASGTSSFDGDALLGGRPPLHPHLRFEGWPAAAAAAASANGGGTTEEWLLRCMRAWPASRCRQLLRFCTALEVLPDAGHPQGLATRPITVRPWDAGTADGSEARAGAAVGRLPRASTCTRELWLPQYSSAEMLEQRLAAAVESLDAEAFHLV